MIGVVFIGASLVPITVGILKMVTADNFSFFNDNTPEENRRKGGIFLGIGGSIMTTGLVMLITNLPKSIESLTSLKYLNIERNNLIKIPISLDKLEDREVKIFK